MYPLILALLALDLMVIVHELGHLLVARAVGITVHTFAIGLGPRLVGVTRGETTYALNLLPIGGYVNMAGEDLDGAHGRVPVEQSFRGKSIAARLAVVCAGPFMNFILAIVLLAVIAMVFGIPVAVSARVGQLVPGYPAEKAGLRPGDLIVAIDGQPMPDGQAIIQAIHTSGGRELTLLVERDGRRFLVRVKARYEATQRVWVTGFSPIAVTSRLDPIHALEWGVVDTGRYIMLVFTFLGRLARSGQLVGALGGPVAAVNLLGQAAHAGWETFANFTVSFSIGIGLFNLFPVPALDGGRAAFLVFEALRRRPVDPRREAYIHLVGLVLLLCLMLALTVRDILHPVHITLP